MNTVSRSLPEMTEVTKQLKEKYGDEQVLVVNAKDVPTELLSKVYSEPDDTSIDALLDKKEFIPRYFAEKNPTYRQLIPYLVVGVNGLFLATKRLENSGEARLVNNIALGTGGHVNPIDLDGAYGDVLTNALMRELDEELDIPAGSIVTVYEAGFINDMSNAVGQEHLGIMYVIEIVTPCDKDVTVKEKDKLEGITIAHKDLGNYYEQYENWSKIVYDYSVIK